jgi:hypothetical protein
MKWTRRILAVVAALCLLAPGCSKRRTGEHPAERTTAEPAPPTPDTTPVAALRTPAGLVLGVEGTPAPVSATPPGAPPPAPQTTPPPAS